MIGLRFIVAALALSSSAAGSEEYYLRADLVSDVPGRAEIYYSLFKDPWGMAAEPGGPWWVAVNGRGSVTLHMGDGTPFPTLNPLKVEIPVSPGGIHAYAAPTGVVYNESPDFEIAPEMPAVFLFVTQDGTIAGWGPDAESYEAELLADNAPGAVYTGAAIMEAGGERYLYAVNFREGRIDVLDSGFSSVPMPEGAFAGPAVPAGLVPFNIQEIEGRFYVAFAAPGPSGRDAAGGEGLGFVGVFDAFGRLLMGLEQGPFLNAPWGMALAPDDFGEYSNHVLIGNSGSGRIAAFDPETGKFKGFLAGPRGGPMTISGLRALGFGNGGLAGPKNALYFTAGGGRGLFGLVVAAPFQPGPFTPEERRGLY
jgi:uncharacterized protein (TIGR03118 family)